MTSPNRAQITNLIHRARGGANSIVWFGDSITFNGGRNAVTPTQYQGNGFWNWTQFLLGHPLQFLSNLGVAGEATPGMMFRLNDVINLRPGTVHILAGTNDPGKGIDISTTIANITKMLDTFESVGIRVILGTIPPQNNSTAPVQLNVRRLNQWIRQQPRLRRNVFVVDYFAALVSPTSNSFAGAGSLLQTNDGIHPNALGAYVMGKTLANAIKAAGFQAPLDLFADEQDATNALLFGAFSGAGVGAAPTGWNPSTPTGSGTVTYSKPNRTDGVTQQPQTRTWQRLVLAPSGAGVATTMTITNANIRVGSWQVGDTISAAVEARITGLDQAPASSTQAGVSVGLRCLNSSNATIAAADDLYWVSGSSSYPNHTLDDRQGVFRTPPLVIPPLTTNLSVVITMGGGGTYDFDRAGIQNVSRYGLVA